MLEASTICEPDLHSSGHAGCPPAVEENDQVPAAGAETAELVDQLAIALRDAVPLTKQLEDATSTVRTTYRDVAEIVVALRHQFAGPAGETHDLRGRSRDYRIAVRAAYESAGVDPNTRVARRITVGVAYWVRNLLLEQYSEEELLKMGVIARSARHSWRMSDTVTTGPDDVMSIALGMLNELAADTHFVPCPEAFTSLMRAAALLKHRIEDDDRVAIVA